MQRWIVFDAFDTLFRFALPVEEIYMRFAVKRGVLTEGCGADIRQSLRTSMAQTFERYPNYGSTNGLSSFNWWSLVVKDTFKGKEDAKVFELADDLFEFYKSKEAYILYEGAQDTLRQLKDNDCSLRLGVLSNCDERIHDILKSLQLEKYFDIVVDSRSIGCMKPDTRAFRIFEEKAKAFGTVSNDFLYVGDDHVKDYQAAIHAGWKAILFQPDKSAAHMKVEHSISKLASLVNHPLVKGTIE